MRLFIALFIVSLGSVACNVTSQAGSQWPQWRGPMGQGRATSGAYASEFGPDQNLAWKVALPGRGCSTPIVWNQQIFVTCPVDGSDALLAYDWAGKQQWSTPIGKERPGKHRNGSGANPSPVTDGTFIFTYFKSGNVAGFDMSGKLLWTHNLQKTYGKDTLYWDLGSSPVLVDDYVVFTVMQEKGSYLVAYEKASGTLAWKTDRNYKTPSENDHSYTTPIVYPLRGKQAIMVWGAEHIDAFDGADGKMMWTCDGFNSEGKANWVTVASPVHVGDVVVIPFGRGKRLIGVPTDGEGQVEQAWRRTDIGAFCPTPASDGKRVYVLGDSGLVSCIDPASGETLWSDQLPRKAAKYYSSPTFADGKLYCAREDGIVFVSKIREDGMALLSQNVMGERIIAAPVAVNDRLLLRGEAHLFCVAAP
jgi:outer membrane protein assembly factor BamB